MPIKFYSDSGSGSCRRVSAVIETLGIEVETIFIDLLNGGNRTEEFLKINPTGMLPVIVIEDKVRGDRVLSEAAAIMIYLCERSENSDLIPEAYRLEVLQWMFWAAEHFRQAAPIYFEENVIALLMGKAIDATRLDEADRRMAIHASYLNEHLKDRQFVVGEQLTLADFDLAAALSQMPRSGVPFDQYEHIIAWSDRLEATIPAWRVTGETLQRRMNAALVSS